MGHEGCDVVMGGTSNFNELINQLINQSIHGRKQHAGPVVRYSANLTWSI